MIPVQASFKAYSYIATMQLKNHHSDAVIYNYNDQRKYCYYLSKVIQQLCYNPWLSIQTSLHHVRS